MNYSHTILLAIGFVVFISCSDNYLIDGNRSEKITPASPQGNLEMGKKGGCTPTLFCIQLSGSMTSGPTTVENCVTSKTTVLAVSPSAGDNPPMIADLSALETENCFSIISGIMGLHEEKNSGLVRMEYYFNQDGIKYTFKARGVLSGDDWLPLQSSQQATIDLSGMEWQIMPSKGKDRGAGCTANGVFPLAPPTIIQVSNGACLN